MKHVKLCTHLINKQKKNIKSVNEYEQARQHLQV